MIRRKIKFRPRKVSGLFSSCAHNCTCSTTQNMTELKWYGMVTGQDPVHYIGISHQACTHERSDQEVFFKP